MRSSELASPEFSLEMFRRGNYARHFEFKVKEAVEKKIITIPVYLSIGQEFNAAAMSMALPEFKIFAQHRCHSLYLCFGGDPAALRDELLGLPSGICGGRAGSNAIHIPGKMIGHSGLMGEQIPIAVGAAYATKEPVLAIMGDASAEEDYIYPSLGFASTHKLPVLFICEDNGLSILTKKDVRRNWEIIHIAQGIRMSGISIIDDPWLLVDEFHGISKCMPALVNIVTCRDTWHAGAGSDGPPAWNRYDMILERLKDDGLIKDAQRIEAENQEKVNLLWQDVLPT